MAEVAPFPAQRLTPDVEKCKMTAPNPSSTDLWRELPTPERHACNHCAKNIPPKANHSLDAPALSLLVQWVVAVDGRVVDSITVNHERSIWSC